VDKLLVRAASLASRGAVRVYRLAAVARRADGATVWAHNADAPQPQPRGHAETRVLRKAGRGAVVFVARVRADGSLACAKPCDRCRAALRARGAVRVVYTTGDPTEPSHSFWL
jgi:tRNA(Arg) A34 adenosine deaminase TadA